MSNINIDKAELIPILEKLIREMWESEFKKSKVTYFQPEQFSQHDINIIERITKVENGIENILVQIKLIVELFNKRFEDMNKRFDDMYKRFESVDKRFEDMRYYIDKRFDETDKKINLGYWIIGFGFTALGTLITFFSVFYK